MTRARFGYVRGRPTDSDGRRSCLTRPKHAWHARWGGSQKAPTGASGPNTPQAVDGMTDSLSVSAPGDRALTAQPEGRPRPAPAQPALTLGVEEELHVVDLDTRELVPRAPEVLDRLDPR